MKYSSPDSYIQSIVLKWPDTIMAMVLIAFLSGYFLYTSLSEYKILLAMLQAVDARAMLVLNFDGGAVADRFFYNYSQLRSWIPLSAALVGYTVFWHQGSWRERLGLVLVIAAMLTFTDQLSSGIIKPLAARPRPSHNLLLAPMLHYVNGYHGGQYGFVSGHATNICCLVTFLGYLYRNKIMRAVLAAFAVTICYSRIYLGVHYLGDILCGALLGIVVARVVIALCPPRLLQRHDRCPVGVVAVWLGTMAVLLFV